VCVRARIIILRSGTLLVVMATRRRVRITFFLLRARRSRAYPCGVRLPPVRPPDDTGAIETDGRPKMQPSRATIAAHTHHFPVMTFVCVLSGGALCSDAVRRFARQFPLETFENHWKIERFGIRFGMRFLCRPSARNVMETRTRHDMSITMNLPA